MKLVFNRIIPRIYMHEIALISITNWGIGAEKQHE